jgi:hypothetical protein
MALRTPEIELVVGGLVVAGILFYLYQNNLWPFSSQLNAHYVAPTHTKAAMVSGASGGASGGAGGGGDLFPQAFNSGDTSDDMRATAPTRAKYNKAKRRLVRYTQNFNQNDHDPWKACQMGVRSYETLRGPPSTGAILSNNSYFNDTQNRQAVLCAINSKR